MYDQKSPDDRSVATDTERSVDETADANAPHEADRPPTDAEERIAERQASEVDPDVGEHYREMTEIGADVKGEGQIVPD